MDGRRNNKIGKFRYYIGQKINKWTLIGHSREKNRWLGKCECGKECYIQPNRASDGCIKCSANRAAPREPLPFVPGPRKTSRRKSVQTEDEKRLTTGFNVASNNARRKHVEFTLTREIYDAIASMPCIYCGGTLPRWGSGLDRIDCKKGYTPTNIVPCCTVCNRMKCDTFTFDEMRELGRIVTRIFKRRKRGAKPSSVPVLIVSPPKHMPLHVRTLF